MRRKRLKRIEETAKRNHEVDWQTTRHHFHDHIYTVLEKNLFRKPDELRGNRSRRDFRKICAYHKDIGHNTVKCNALRDEIEI